MKIIIILCFFVLSFANNLWAKEDKSKKEAAPSSSSQILGKKKLDFGKLDPQGELIFLKVNGLVCDFCARSLEKMFGARKEVSGLNVDLTSKIISINLKRGHAIDDKTLKILVKRSGFSLVSITRRKPNSKKRKK